LNQNEGDLKSAFANQSHKTIKDKTEQNTAIFSSRQSISINPSILFQSIKIIISVNNHTQRFKAVGERKRETSHTNNFCALNYHTHSYHKEQDE